MKPLFFYLIKATFLSAFLFLFSCSRSGDDRAKITFNLPATFWLNQAQQQSSSNYVSNLLNISSNPSPVVIANNVSSQNNNKITEWNTIVPTGYQSGQHDTNCLFVVSTGPQMNKFSCSKNGITEPVFEFEEISETALVGSSISFEVTPGNNRVFLLLGMHASSAVDCKRLTDPSFNRSFLSKPYIVGTSKPVTVLSGSSNRVEIKVVDTIDTAKFIDYCNLNSGNGLSNAPKASSVGSIEISLEQGLIPNVTHTQGCVPAVIRVKDTTGLLTLPSPFTDLLELESTNEVSLDIATSAYNCAKGITAESFSTFGNFETKVWITRPSLNADNANITFDEESDGKIELNREGKFSTDVDIKISEKLFVVSSQSNLLAVTQAPERIQNETCYTATLSANYVNFSVPNNLPQSLVSSVSYEDNPNAPATAKLEFHTDPLCGDTGLSATDFSDAANRSYEIVYFRVRGYNLGDEVTISHSFNIGPTTKTKMIVTGGSNQSERYKISGPKDLIDPSIGSNCYGPFRVELVNELGASVLATRNLSTGVRPNKRFRMSFESGTTTRIYSRGAYSTDRFTPACDETRLIQNGDSSLIIPADSGYFEFYVRIMTYQNTILSLNRYISVNDETPITDSVAGAIIHTNHLIQITNSAGQLPIGTIHPSPHCERNCGDTVNETID
jgi:hypothetical protein